MPIAPLNLRIASPHLAVSLFAVLLTLGCGRDGPERVVVSGAVSYQGQPVAAGVIRFIPTAGTSAPMWGAYIVDGKYTTKEGGGVPVGIHRVEILGYHVSGNTSPAIDAPADARPSSTPTGQYLPAKYNTASELEVTIESGQGKMVKDFQLAE